MMAFWFGHLRAQESCSFRQWICESFVRDRRARSWNVLVVSANAYLHQNISRSIEEDEKEHQPNMFPALVILRKHTHPVRLIIPENSLIQYRHGY